MIQIFGDPIREYSRPVTGPRNLINQFYMKNKITIENSGLNIKEKEIKLVELTNLQLTKRIYDLENELTDFKNEIRQKNQSYNKEIKEYSDFDSITFKFDTPKSLENCSDIH